MKIVLIGNVYIKKNTYTHKKKKKKALGQGDIQLDDLSNSKQIEEKLDEEQEMADELKFYMEQIYRIIKPVVVCIILSIFWVKVANDGSSDYTPTRPTYVNVSPTNTATNTTTATTGSTIAQSFTNAAIIIGQIIGVTILIVFFFKKGWIKILIGFFMVVVLLLLGFMTYLLLL